MGSQSALLDRIRQAGAKRLLFLPHAVRQMSRPDRMISTREVADVVASGELIEDYPSDPRGHSGLVLGIGSGGRAIHVVAAPKDEYLAIITAYLPDPSSWEEGFKVRRREK
jgi:hypothetical protein